MSIMALVPVMSGMVCDDLTTVMVVMSVKFMMSLMTVMAVGLCIGSNCNICYVCNVHHNLDDFYVLGGFDTVTPIMNVKSMMA
jgi:hypothetical protein